MMSSINLLIEELKKDKLLLDKTNKWKYIKKKIKEIHRKEIIDSFYNGFCQSGEGFNHEFPYKSHNINKEEEIKDISAEEYYKETFKKI